MNTKTTTAALRGSITAAIFTIAISAANNSNAAVTFIPGVEKSFTTTSNYTPLFGGVYGAATDDVVDVTGVGTITGVFFRVSGTIETDFVAAIGGSIGLTFTYDMADARYENNSPQAISAFLDAVGGPINSQITSLAAGNTIQQLGVTVVPEPSISVLSAFVTIGLFRRRRS